MEKQIAELPGIKLVGLSARTNYMNEINPMLAKITPTVQQYFHTATADSIPNRRNPGVTYCVYTDYENGVTGDYTYFIGEEVDSFDDVPEGLKAITISPQTYAKFTTQPGPMPMVCIGAWQKIWQMSPTDLGGDRRFHADFEVYDERAADHLNVVLDVYVGLHQAQ